MSTCKELSYNKRWPQTCGKPVKVFRDGIGYCGIHDPVRQIEMQRRREEKRTGTTTTTTQDNTK
jgi:hypothetical protein